LLWCAYGSKPAVALRTAAIQAGQPQPPPCCIQGGTMSKEGDIKSGGAIAMPPPPASTAPSSVCVFGRVTVGPGPVPKFKVRAKAPVLNAELSTPETLT